MEGLFTSESVSEGHPDKMADQMADAILDAILTLDSKARVACDILIKNNTVMVSGEMTTTATVDVDSIVRLVASGIGYNDPSLGFDSSSCKIISLLSQQSPDIAQGIDRGMPEEQGAGDQGTVFGYACQDTGVLMPAPIYYAHQLVRRQAEMRKQGNIPWLRPDAKAQVTFRYDKDKPVEVMAIVFSTQHDEHVSQNTIREWAHDDLIKPVFRSEWLTKNTQYFINPAGRFVVGGPVGDAGLTGRKIAVDAYGGMARDGGGCFSGKDPSKLDRSGAYMARYIAKNIVASKLALRCEVQISYAIGIRDPIAFNVETFGTGIMDDTKIMKLVRERFDLSPFSIIEFLDLKKPIYCNTACYGHFGRTEFPWEYLDSAFSQIHNF